MRTISSFHATCAEPARISAVMAEYLAFERARTYRRLFVIRFGLLALAIGTLAFGLHVLPAPGSWLSLGLCLIPPAWAWIGERCCRSRLSRHLRDVTTVDVATRRGS